MNFNLAISIILLSVKTQADYFHLFAKSMQLVIKHYSSLIMNISGSLRLITEAMCCNHFLIIYIEVIWECCISVCLQLWNLLASEVMGNFFSESNQ